MPTAALISGGLGLAGSIGSAYIGSNAARQASQAQIGFGQQALAQLQSALGPLLSAGRSITDASLGPLTRLLTPGPDQTAALSQLPGFQFAQDWGQRAVENLGSRMGFGGNTLAAGAQFATGTAQQGFGSLVGMLQNFLGSGLGAQAHAGTALGQGTAGVLGGMGNAAASGILGSANAISGGITGGTNALSNAAMINALGSKLAALRGGGPGGDGIYGTPSELGAGGFSMPGFDPIGFGG